MYDLINPQLTKGFLTTFKFAWRYWSQQPYLVLLLLVLMAFYAIFEVLVPVITGKIVDSFTSATGDWQAIALVLAYLIGARIIAYIFRQCAVFIWHHQATQIMAKIVTHAFDVVQRMNTNWHTNNFAGSTVRKITRGMWGFDQFGDTLYLAIYPHVLANIAVAVILFQNGWAIGMPSVLGSVLFLYVSVKLSTDYLAPALAESNQLDSQIGGLLSDSITCNSVVKAFASEEREREKLVGIAEQWRVKTRKAWWRIETLFSVQVTLFILIEISLAVVSFWSWLQGYCTVGDIVTILASFQLAQSHMKELGNDIRNLQRSINDMEDMIGLEEIDAEIPEASDALPLEVEAGAITLERVTFGYENQEKPIYQHFSLSIKSGEKIALVGAFGSGKSTFIKLIQRLYDVQAGTISIDNYNIRRVTKQSLRKAIAMVPQEPILFHRSIRENIAYCKPDATQTEIEDAARQAFAHDFIMGLSEGYNTEVGERGVKLSGGERQRVAIARAILADCPILILDEATSSLDSISEALIQRALANLMTGRTTIIIAHRLSTIKAVDRILVFSQGKIIEEGSHEILLSQVDSHYGILYSLQSKGMLPLEGVST